MSHPFRGSSKSTSRAKFKALTGKNGSSDGDADGSQLQPAHKRYAEVGKIAGEAAMSRPDRRARGGRSKSKVNINIITAPQERGGGPPPLPPPALMGAAPGPGSLPFPAGGAPPPMRKSGGLVKMTGGGEGGAGRLEKAHNAKIMRRRGG